MTPEEKQLIVDNVLVFDFMECTHSNDPAIDLWEMSSLKYRNSWNLLMPVISKCYKMYDQDAAFHMSNESNDLDNAMRTDNISEAFKNVVLLISFYKMQQQDNGTGN